MAATHNLIIKPSDPESSVTALQYDGTNSAALKAMKPAGTGTVTSVTTSKIVTGSGTSFYLEAEPGGYISIDSGADQLIDKVLSNTSLKLVSNAIANKTGTAFKTYGKWFLETIERITARWNDEDTANTSYWLIQNYTDGFSMFSPAEFTDKYEPV